MRTDRILLITARADHGGGPRHVLDLLGALEKSSFEFFIAAPDQEPYFTRFKSLCHGTVTIPARSFSLKSFFELRRFVKQHEIGIIHSHGRGAGLYSRLLGLTLPELRVVHSFHGIHREPSAVGRIKMAIDRVLAFTRYFAFFTSESEKRDAYKYSFVRVETRSVVINNVVDLSRFRPRPRIAFERTDQPLRIGSILRADHAKGPEFFLRLANEATSVGAWSCVGATREELKEFGSVCTNLEVIGRLPDPADWLSALDVYVSTSRWEAHPLAVLEAMAAGCICVLSDIPSHRFFVDADSALCFDPADVDGFMKTIAQLRGDAELRERLIRNARTLVLDGHSIEKFRAKIEIAYAEAIQP